MGLINKSIAKICIFFNIYKVLPVFLFNAMTTGERLAALIKFKLVY